MAAGEFSNSQGGMGEFEFIGLSGIPTLLHSHKRLKLQLKTDAVQIL